MADKAIPSDVTVGVDLRIFPSPVVESVLDVLSDKLDAEVSQQGVVISVHLKSSDGKLTPKGIEHLFDARLTSAALREHFSPRVRDLSVCFAQTAYSVTTERQKQVREFLEKAAQEAIEQADEASEAQAMEPWAFRHFKVISPSHRLKRVVATTLL